MRKTYILLVCVVLFMLSAQIALAVPAWKKDPTPTTTTVPTTTTTTPTTSTNIPPQITSISLKPDPAALDSTIKCSVTSYDGNGDAVKVSYKWSTTGSYSLSNISGSALDLSKVEGEAEGDVITCVATPNDGKVKGIAGQESVTISTKSINWEMIAVFLAIIGVVAGWIISRMIRGKTAKYMNEIDKVYQSYNKNSNKCEAELTNIRDKIEDDFKKGNLNDQTLALLEGRIDKYSEKLRGSIIDSKFQLSSNLNKKIKDMLSDGVITKEEYAHFKDLLKEEKLGSKDKKEIDRIMKRWEKSDNKLQKSKASK